MAVKVSDLKKNTYFTTKTKQIRHITKVKLEPVKKGGKTKKEYVYYRARGHNAAWPYGREIRVLAETFADKVWKKVWKGYDPDYDEPQKLPKP